MIQRKKKARRRKRTAGQLMAARLLSSTKRRAKKKHLLYQLAPHAKQITRRICRGKCELSGLPFDFRGGAMAPSIDRIISTSSVVAENSYTLKNTRIVLWALNASMGTWGFETTMRIMSATLNGRHGKQFSHRTPQPKPAKGRYNKMMAKPTPKPEFRILIRQDGLVKLIPLKRGTPVPSRLDPKQLRWA